MDSPQQQVEIPSLVTRTAALLTLTALLLGACGPCGREADWRDTDEQLSDPAALSREAGVVLPVVAPEVGAPRSEPHVRVLVSRHRISVEVVGWLLSWPKDMRGRLQAALNEEEERRQGTLFSLWETNILNGWEVTEDQRRGYFITPLFDVLTEVRESARAWLRRLDHEASQPLASEDSAQGAKLASLEKDMRRLEQNLGAVNMLVHRDAPFSLVAQVLYTAGQAQFETFHAVVQQEGELRSLTIAGPRYCTGPSSPMWLRAAPHADRFWGPLGIPPKEPEREPECHTPVVRVVENGLQVRDQVGWGCGLATKGKLGAKDSNTEPAYPQLILAPGVCPSVPCAKDGELDRHGLLRLLERMGTLGERCPGALLVPQPKSTWAEVTSLMVTLRAAGYPAVMVAIADQDGEVDDCAKARVIGE